MTAEPRADVDPASDVNPPRTVSTAWAVAGLVLCGLTALLAGLIEVLLTPLYLGRWLFPVTLVLAVVTNVALPLAARRIVDTTAAAAVPLVLWLAAVLLLSLPRREGDVLLPGGSGGQQAVSYGLILVGAAAGAITLAWTAGAFRPRRPGPPSESSPARR
jgi:uncharacterized membrane protein YhaH (DUF805 family)